ncbi:MAG TPA: hypothetical protein VK879_13975 [Candidatus Sulfomarinibacteraceae bacterium]|nr:hypothetical protein [Candidatus Sulfomarinibacteraceae bacterium]
MASTKQLRESVFLSTLVWAWAIHHTPMFDGGLQISLSVSTLTYPAALLAAYLAVYRRRTILAAGLLLLTVVLTELHFNYTPAQIAESLLVLGGTGVLYVVGLRVMVRRMKERMRDV